MKKIRLVLIMGLLVCLCTAGLSSCKLVKELLPGGSASKHTLLRYLEEKYGEEFVYRETPRGQGDGYYEIWVRPKDHEGDNKYEFTVREDLNTGEISDGYPNVLFRESAAKELSRIASGVFGECIANSDYIMREPTPSEINEDTPPLEFLKEDTFACEFATTCDVSKKEQVTQEFIDELESQGILLTFRIMFVTEEVFQDMQENANLSKEKANEVFAKYYLDALNNGTLGEKVLACGQFGAGYYGDHIREEHITGKWW
jgi:hypothetical protein